MDFDAVPLEVGGRPYFLRYSLGALQILQRRLAVASFADAMARIQSVLPGSAPESEAAADDGSEVAAAAVRDATMRASLDDLAEVLWAGLSQAGIAAHYKTPNDLMCAFGPRDLPRLLTLIGASVALGFARPDSEREAADGAANPPAAAPNPSA